MGTFVVPQLMVDDKQLTIYLELTGTNFEGRMGCRYTVADHTGVVLRGDDLRSGVWQIPSEREMVIALCGFLSAAGESFAHSGSDSEYAEEYTKAEQAWLAANYERLGMAEADWTEAEQQEHADNFQGDRYVEFGVDR